MESSRNGSLHSNPFLTICLEQNLFAGLSKRLISYILTVKRIEFRLFRDFGFGFASKGSKSLLKMLSIESLEALEGFILPKEQNAIVLKYVHSRGILQKRSRSHFKRKI